ISEGAMRKPCSFDVCCECASSCCQDARPPLTEERKRIIKDSLRNRGCLSGRLFVTSDYSFPAVDSAGFCVFFDKGSKKSFAHEGKTETCKAGPITFDINRRLRSVE